jgi:hypothetical protein
MMSVPVSTAMPSNNVPVSLPLAVKKLFDDIRDAVRHEVMAMKKSATYSTSHISSSNFSIGPRTAPTALIMTTTDYQDVTNPSYSSDITANGSLTSTDTSNDFMTFASLTDSTIGCGNTATTSLRSNADKQSGTTTSITYKSSRLSNGVADDEVYYCSHAATGCVFKTTMLEKLKNHIKKHKHTSSCPSDEMNLFVCPVESRGYINPNKTNINVHMNTHIIAGDKPQYKCDFPDCNYTTKQRYALRRHCAHVHSARGTPLPAKCRSGSRALNLKPRNKIKCSTYFTSSVSTTMIRNSRISFMK